MAATPADLPLAALKLYCETVCIPLLYPSSQANRNVIFSVTAVDKICYRCFIPVNVDVLCLHTTL